MRSLWLKVRDFANARLRERPAGGCDLRCPWCHHWMHSEVAAKVVPLDSGNYRYECGQCSGISDWTFDAAPVPLIVATWRPYPEKYAQAMEPEPTHRASAR